MSTRDGMPRRTPRRCRPTAHTWQVASVTVMSPADLQGWYTVLLLRQCATCAVVEGILVEQNAVLQRTRIVEVWEARA